MTSLVTTPPSINVSPPNSSSTTVVPQYPYNVSMPSFAGALLPYERSPLPDDNEVQTRLPSRCVDYLSHDWDESDVWTSWKAMTRHKHEMANGIRLENASWRTWAKQRSNLKTISPETLNWLKDSDVTWLYGPLHTAVDPVPTKLPSIKDRFGLDGQAQPSESSNISANSHIDSPTPIRTAKTPGKPILKHRSLCEILGVGNVYLTRNGGESTSDDENLDANRPTGHSKRPRVSVAHHTSDSKLDKRPLREGRRGSPPTLVNGYESSDPTTGSEDSDAARNTSSISQIGPRNTNTNELTKPKKHISFSHRVEQCIAVDGAQDRSTFLPKGQLPPYGRKNEIINSNIQEEEDDDDEDDDDDLLTFRSSASRYPGLHAVSHRYSSHTASNQTVDPYILSNKPLASLSGSLTSEPLTIARMAPTTLKSSEVLPAPSPVVVYDQDSTWTSPHLNSTSLPYRVTPSPSDTISLQYTLPESSSSLNKTHIASRNSQSITSYPLCTYGPVSTSKVSPAPIASSLNEKRSLSSSRYGSSSSLSQWGVTTPDDDDTEEFTAMGFDYFSGPDLGLGDEYDVSQLSSQHGFNSTDLVTSSANNQDNTLTFPRSILKTHVTTSPIPSSVLSVSKPKSQDHSILVSQVKLCQKSSTSSSSSSASSPPSNQNDFTSSLIIPSSNEKVNSHPSIPINSSYFNPDRIGRESRGRSSSRGSSASSFERGSIDRRPSSNSPLQSPPLSSKSSLIGSSTTASRLSNRSGVSANQSSSIDGNRSFDRKQNLIKSTINQDIRHNFHSNDTSEPKLKQQSNHVSQSLLDLKSTLSTSTCLSEAKETLTDSSYTLARSLKSHHSSMGLPSHKPCLISAPKLASAQLDGSSTTPLCQSKVISQENKSETEQNNRANSSTTYEGNTSGSPTLLSLLSRQTSNSPTISWWSEERVAQGTVGTKSDRSSTLTSRPRSLDGCSSTFLGRSSSESNGFARVRASQSEEAVRRLSGDEFGFGNYYEDPSVEDEDVGRDETGLGAGVMSRAAEIVETARDIVGAIWNVGSRSLWGSVEESTSTAKELDQKDTKERVKGRRVSTGGLVDSDHLQISQHNPSSLHQH